MEPIKRIKAKVISDKWPDSEKGKIILIPETLKEEFVRNGYGEIVKESPEVKTDPETKAHKKPGRKPKTKE